MLSQKVSRAVSLARLVSLALVAPHMTTIAWEDFRSFEERNDEVEKRFASLEKFFFHPGDESQPT